MSEEESVAVSRVLELFANDAGKEVTHLTIQGCLFSKSSSEGINLRRVVSVQIHQSIPGLRVDFIRPLVVLERNATSLSEACIAWDSMLSGSLDVSSNEVARQGLAVGVQVDILEELVPTSIVASSQAGAT